MGFWAKIFGGGVAETATAVTDGLDNLFTSDEERQAGQKALEAVRANLKTKLAEMEGQLETFIQGELTKRHALDMQSDSRLSKNIRPATFIVFQCLFGIVVVVAYFGKTLDSSLVAIIGGVLQTIVMFYFGGRSLEKGFKMLAGKLGKG